MNIQNTVARIKYLLKPGERLSHRVVRGAFWVIANRLLGLATTMILARVLAPSDFGLFGIALLAMAALETFSQTGLNLALVQKKQDITPYLNTAWTVQLIRGCFLALIIFATAPFLSAFFDTPAAMPILQVIGFSPLILGFTNIGVIYFNKELEFHKQYGYELSGLTASLVVSLTTIIFLKNAWALIFGLLARNLVQVAMSYVIHPYRPSLRLNQVQFMELFCFGKWVLGSSILLYLVFISIYLFFCTKFDADKRENLDFCIQLFFSFFKVGNIFNSVFTLDIDAKYFVS
jgi:O-antigen/teichoic acid export membrane protein